jgi:hypothetical protein
MESMATGQATNIVILFQQVDANGTRIAGICEKLRGDSGVNVIIFFFFFFTGCSGMFINCTCGCSDFCQMIVLFDGYGWTGFLCTSCFNSPCVAVGIPSRTIYLRCGGAGSSCIRSCCIWPGVAGMLCFYW